MMLFRRHRKKQTDFTRQRKLHFNHILISILISLKHSLTLEIDDFLQKLDIDGDIDSYTKQAYSTSRQKLLPSAFIELNDIALEEIYSNDFKTFKGYRLVAVDGSTIELPNTQKLKDKYGVFSRNNANYPAGRICVTYDVLNKVILNGKIFSYNESENVAAKELVPAVYKSNDKDIFIFDRGFASVKMIVLLNKLGRKYIFRVQRGFLKEVNDFRKGLEDDQTLSIDITERRIKTNRIHDLEGPVKFDLRAVRIKLESEDEILVTNLSENKMSLEELGQLYNSRWGIETNYNYFKNVLELENFTGDTDTAVQQDFYATIYITNLASIMITDEQAEYEKNNKGNEKKHSYKINTSIAMGYLKKHLLHVLLQENPKKALKLYKKFIKKLAKQVIPIRANRKFARPLKHKPKYGRTNKKIL